MVVVLLVVVVVLVVVVPVVILVVVVTSAGGFVLRSLADTIFLRNSIALSRNISEGHVLLSLLRIIIGVIWLQLVSAEIHQTETEYATINISIKCNCSLSMSATASPIFQKLNVYNSNKEQQYVAVTS